MGIISRFTEIMKSNINAQLDKCEDPSKMIDQTLRELKENFAEVKKETAGVMYLLFLNQCVHFRERGHL